MTTLCSRDGVAVAQTRAGRWVHTDSLPEGVDSDHEVDPVDSSDFGGAMSRAVALHDAALDMLTHHDNIHPGSDCEWALKLRMAMR